MGGRIWVESEAGKGSAFHFTSNLELVKSFTDEVTIPDSPDLRYVPVLVVDDNATNRRILEEILVSLHMVPTLVDGGRAALVELHQAKKLGKPFPLVLTDMQMPEIDGFMLAEQIKQDPELAGATIMMLTSAGGRGDADRCRQLGVSAYLMKPFRQAELLDAISTTLVNRMVENKRAALVTRHSLRESQRIFHILLAEGNVVNQTLAVRLLEKRGHTVVVANNGREALAILEEESFAGFDAVLMDVQMPEMDGFEATAAIRNMEKSLATYLPLIAMTAHTMKGDPERCQAAGMDGYVSKLIHPDELYATIERMTPTATKVLTLFGQRA